MEMLSIKNFVQKQESQIAGMQKTDVASLLKKAKEGKKTEEIVFFAQAYLLAAKLEMSTKELSELVKEHVSSSYGWGHLKTEISNALNSSGQFEEKLFAKEKGGNFSEHFGSLEKIGRGRQKTQFDFSDFVSEETPIVEAKKERERILGGKDNAEMETVS